MAREVARGRGSPDHATLTGFKGRLVARKGEQALTTRIIKRL